MTDTIWRGSNDLRPLLRPIGFFVEDPHNARVHTERNLSAIARSFKTFGQQKPIVFEVDGDLGRVVAGNGTVLAVAQRLGWSHIAAVCYGGTEAPAAGFAVADNRTGELAEWDHAQLAATLHELEGCSVTLDDMGWTRFELEALVAESWAPDDGDNVGLGDSKRRTTGESDGTEPSKPTPSEGGRSVKFTAEQWAQVEPLVAHMRARTNDESLTPAQAIRLASAEYLEAREA